MGKFESIIEARQRLYETTAAPVPQNQNNQNGQNGQNTIPVASNPAAPAAPATPPAPPPAAAPAAPAAAPGAAPPAPPAAPAPTNPAPSQQYTQYNKDAIAQTGDKNLINAYNLAVTKPNQLTQDQINALQPYTLKQS